MKIDLTPMKLVEDVLKFGALFTLLGGVLYSTGWIVSGARAQEMVQESALQLQHKYDRALLVNDINDLSNQINLMLMKPDRTAWDEQQLTLWQTQLAGDQVKLINFDKQAENQ